MSSEWWENSNLFKPFFWVIWSGCEIVFVTWKLFHCCAEIRQCRLVSHWMRCSMRNLKVFLPLLALLRDVPVTCLGLFGGNRNWKWNWTDNKIYNMTMMMTTRMNSKLIREGWQHFLCTKQTRLGCRCLKSQASLLVSDPRWNWRHFLSLLNIFPWFDFLHVVRNSREKWEGNVKHSSKSTMIVYDMEKVNFSRVNLASRWQM